MAEPLINWTPRTSTSHVKRELEAIYATAVTTDLENSILAKESGNALFIIRAKTGIASLRAETFSNTSTHAARIEGIRGRGTVSSKVALLSGDRILEIRGFGYRTASAANESAKVLAVASENWSSGAAGSRIGFHATPNGSTSVAEVLRIDGDGTASLVQDPTISSGTHLTTKNYVDSVAGGSGVESLFIPASDFIANASSTLSDEYQFNNRLLGFPDSVTSTAVGWVNCPASWAGEAVQTDLYYSGKLGSNIYYCFVSVNGKDVGDNFDASGLAQVCNIPVGGTANVITSFTLPADETLPSDTKILNVQIIRLGADANDTQSGAFEFLGAKLTKL